MKLDFEYTEIIHIIYVKFISKFDTSLVLVWLILLYSCSFAASIVSDVVGAISFQHKTSLYIVSSRMGVVLGAGYTFT
jgi:hypothetical protein